METQRQLKVSRLLHKDLGEIFQQEGKNFKNALITVTKVNISKDLKVGKVYLSLFATENKEELLKKIISRSKEIRHLLAMRVKHQLKSVPNLYFNLDDSLDYIDNIDNLLKK